MDNLVDIACFQNLEEAEIVASMLRADGIDCYVRDSNTNRVMRGYIGLDVHIDVLEKDYPRALEIMQEGGFITLDEANEDEQPKSFIGSLALEMKIVILILFILSALALIIYMQSIISTTYSPI